MVVWPRMSRVTQLMIQETPGNNFKYLKHNILREKFAVVLYHLVQRHALVFFKYS